MPFTPGFTETHYDGVTVLASRHGGAFPFGNSVVVGGSAATLVLDPSLELDHDPVEADAVMVSHAHEDHIAGLRHFAADKFAHRLDVEGVRSLQVLVDNYGLTPEQRAATDEQMGDLFGLPDGFPETAGVDDEHVFELGDLTATVIHLPGHTPGHCGVLVEPTGFFYIADIDLTSFGPMYGDTQSSVEDYLASIARVREIDARWFATFHQKGVVEGRNDFRTRLDAYEGIIHRREERLLDFLAQPRRLDEIIAHRLVYRPHVDFPAVEAVEKRTAELHLERLARHGQVAQTDDGAFYRM